MDISKIQNLKNQAISAVLEAQSDDELERLRIAYLGRKGEITQLLKTIPSLRPSERKEIGQVVNDAKKAIEQALKEAKKSQQTKKIDFDQEWLDVTAPGKRPAVGHLHLVTETIEEITNIFEKIGFTRKTYPEIEWDWYSFGALNMPENHPARDDWETLYLDKLKHQKYGRAVLTPHTSSGQIREMEQQKPPIRMLNVAKCYRRQADVSHAPMFYQFETLVVDKDINITHLKGTLDYFARQYFGKDRKTRIRPFHFQFTEPSFEVDVTCIVCGGKGCPVCKAGWLELGGAGMVHPLVLKQGGIDPEKYSGFASGFGVERVLMMKYGIDDIRLLFSGDLRILQQF
ncbi:MAG: phenylalanine--tRNA ligase subunit alpha [Candidatus Marinimicrobia bacterium]|nr:phenylalanine--tRNA ligase subunit alpha [Candidatus Neomarinimicrobiota bacterium]